MNENPDSTEIRDQDQDTLSVINDEAESPIVPDISDGEFLNNDNPSLINEESDVINANELSSESKSTPLTAESVAQNLSLLARTGNGLSFAYTRLEIHGKGITSIDILESYPHLRYVDLSENFIKELKPMATLTYLLSLDLHKNNITAIPSCFSECKYLQQLNLSKNAISQKELPSLSMLAWLNLCDNNLKELNMEGYYELIHLEIRGNKLSTLESINSPKLQRLYLGKNNISKINGLDDKPTLTTLHLRDNKIETLDGFSDALKSLAYLNFRGNSVEKLEEVAKLVCLPNLKVLVLLENPIDEIPNYRLEVIFILKKLERLDKEPISEDEREEAQQFINQKTRDITETHIE
ncbi:Leucine-rich repeat-containing protein 23 [Nowakowskiella sp. JEL0078]|nr:Leucine-rich repeat-containing protein 23 [Nowakowskiella sp. JEL0078]